MSEVAVTDAHAFIWAATGKSAKLGRQARQHFRGVDAGTRAVYVPTIVLIEIGEAARAGNIQFPGLTYTEWVAELAASGRYIPYDLTLDVVLAAERLYDIPERGDRLIAATALVLDCPLITRDPAIAGAAGVPVIW